MQGQQMQAQPGANTQQMQGQQEGQAPQPAANTQQMQGQQQIQAPQGGVTTQMQGQQQVQATQPGAHTNARPADAGTAWDKHQPGTSTTAWCIYTANAVPAAGTGSTA